MTVKVTAKRTNYTSKSATSSAVYVPWDWDDDDDYGSSSGSGSGSGGYANCSAARAAGAAPLYAGQPGYSSSLDRDGDGVACE
jgi:hypothetical protein